MLIDGIHRARSAIDRWIFAAEDPRRLAALRIGLFSLLAARLALNDYGAYAGQPGALFDPISFFELLPGMPSPELTTSVQAAGVAAASCAAAGFLPRLSFPLAFVCALFLGLMLNATGKVIHNDVLLVLCLLPLVASPRAASRAWHARRLWRGMPSEKRAPAAAYGWPVRTAMLVVALAYLFVGLQKLRYSGIDWATTENLRWVLYAASDNQATPNAIALFVADRMALVHLFALGTIILEVGFFACLLIPRLRWVFVPGVVSLHIGIWLAMGLDYTSQWLTVLIVFLDAPLIAGWLAGRLTPPNARSFPR